MSMQKIGVGTIIENKINSPEGVQVNMSDSGIDVLVLLREPSNDEIGVFEAKQMPFQMKLAVEGDVIFFLFKFGEMPWMDAPFRILSGKPRQFNYRDESASKPYRTYGCFSCL